MPQPPKGTTAADRFSKSIFKDPVSGCWLWTARRMTYEGKLTYGVFKVEGKIMPVHRFSYQHHIGAIPEGLKICHKCDVQHCANPDHLFAGTQLENVRDCIRKGRFNFKGNAILNEAQVIEIRTRYQPWSRGPNSGMSLCKEFGIKKTTLSYIIGRMRWKNI